MTDYEPTAFFREITARLRGHIARFDINQADLALLCDVSQSQFSKIIRGTRPMSVDQLFVICQSLEIDIAELVQDVERFVNDRGTYASPVAFVVDEVREEQLNVWTDQFLDPWGRRAVERWNVAHPSEDVPTVDLKKDQHDLAARPREKEPTDEQ